MAQWPYAEEHKSPKFLLKRGATSNKLELQEDCLRLIDTEVANSNASHVAFFTVVGPKKTGKTEMLIAMRNHLLGLKSNITPTTHKAAVATERDEGILLLATPAIKTCMTDKNSKICFFGLDIWAPIVSDGNYALLVDFCLLVSSQVVFIERFPGKREFVWPGPLTAIPKPPAKNSRCTPKQKRVMVLLKDFDVGVQVVPNYLQLIQGTTSTFVSLRFLNNIWPTERASFIRTNIQARKYVHTLMSSVILDVKYALPGKEYTNFLKDTLTLCSNPKPYKPSQSKTVAEAASSQPQRGEVPHQVKQEVAADILLKFQDDFNKHAQTWKKILFLEEPVLESEFRNFVELVTKSSFKNYQGRIPTDDVLKEVICTAFDGQFQDFKRKYKEESQKSAKLDANITARLEIIENELYDSCVNMTLDEFQAQLEQKYTMHVEACKIPCEDFSLLPQWQLRCQKRFDNHAECLKLAVLGIQQTEDRLTVEFTDHLKDPETNPLPQKPCITDTGDMDRLPILTQVLQDCLEEVHQRALKRYQTLKAQVEEKNRAFREQAAQMFQQQATQGKRTITPDLTRVKKNRF